jgi:hypothetical protein
VSDGCPAYLPDDIRRFVASPPAYAAWVAEVGGQVVGHVALDSRCTSSFISDPSRSDLTACAELSPSART